MINLVNVEQLMDRQPAAIDRPEIAAYVTNRVVMVTGAGGSIGSELCRHIALFQPKLLVMVDHEENGIYTIDLELARIHPLTARQPIIADIRNHKRMKDIFSAFLPSIVFHAAAHKHVPLMELNCAEAVTNNIFGTRNIIELAHHFEADKVVFISTDKTVKPSSIMGATKRISEMLVQAKNESSHTKFSIVRFGNVLGSRGSFIPLFQQQILAGGPITVTHREMVRYLMTIREAVQLVMQAGAFAQGGEIFVLDMGQPVRITELAERLIRLYNLEPHKDIAIVYIGIRPGEKLVEELLTHEEGIRATKHDRIWICNAREFTNKEQLYQWLNKLENMIEQDNDLTSAAAIKALFQQLLPHFPSQDSVNPIS
ncbi:MAG: polysaccharide biosynthesis protein [Paenibacillus sp.]|nr:polysaccharide biosynthesis protein [Paenibacillus sp.]